jgi:hypothetical protein
MDRTSPLSPIALLCRQSLVSLKSSSVLPVSNKFLAHCCISIGLPDRIAIGASCGDFAAPGKWVPSLIRPTDSGGHFFDSLLVD